MKKKLDKNKIYAFIGQAVIYGTIYLAAVVGTVWAFTQNTVF